MTRTVTVRNIKSDSKETTLTKNTQKWYALNAQAATAFDRDLNHTISVILLEPSLGIFCQVVCDTPPSREATVISHTNECRIKKEDINAFIEAMGWHGEFPMSKEFSKSVLRGLQEVEKVLGYRRVYNAELDLHTRDLDSAEETDSETTETEPYTHH